MLDFYWVRVHCGYKFNVRVAKATNRIEDDYPEPYPCYYKKK